MEQDMVSFVLRFVREAGEEQQARWRGMIKHVQSNTEASFSQFAEAMAFMQGYINDIAQANLEEAQRMGEGFGNMNPFMETTRLWGEFMPRYSKMMLDSMGEAMSSGTGVAKPMEEMMDATLSAWGMPTRNEQESLSASMQAIADQLAALTDKISDLENQLAELKIQSKEQTE